ncbi:hypothetical protein [Amycolatopsis sp. cmx-4-54]|uniref:hypothetical protein n=1 Tax=Amycolatopsis sp. cmx-4-54 TaxID=2790936 RepID=UPI0039798401
MGAQNLDDRGDECSQLHVEFGKFSRTLPRWQEKVTDGFLMQLSSTLMALDFHISTYKQTGINYQLIKDDQVPKAGTADYIKMMIDDIYICIMGASSALAVRPGRPIRYVRQLRSLTKTRQELAAKYAKNDTTETASTSGATNVGVDVDAQSRP